MSAYLDRLVQDRFQRAQMAVATLHAAEWKSNEILAACDVLNGCWLHVHAPTWHGASLADGPEYAGNWEVSPERWQEMAKQISERQDLAFALDLVVSEFWSGNSYIDRIIRRGGEEGG